MTDMDRTLQEIAAKNWEMFVDLIGDDAIKSAKICLLRRDNRSYGEIAVKLNITRDCVIYRCEKCDAAPSSPLISPL